MLIRTQRLELVPANAALTWAAIDSSAALARALDAIVPDTWPPEYLDRPALEFMLARLAEGAAQAGWWMHFVMLVRCGSAPLLIGSAGYAGPPKDDGTVEIGYGIVSDQRRRGYATEAVDGLVRRAFELGRITRVIAETLPELVGSIGVLTSAGFRPTACETPETLRFELTRAMFLARSQRHA